MQQVWRRRVALANVAVVVVALLTIGQIRYDEQAKTGNAGLSQSAAPGLGSPKAVLNGAAPAPGSQPQTVSPVPGAVTPVLPGQPTNSVSAAPVTGAPTTTLPVPGSSAVTTAPAKASTPTATKAAGRASTKPTTKKSGGSKATASASASAAAKPLVAVPNYGLLTQGVTPTTVLIGVDYNKSGCGGIGALESQFSQAAVGDPEKSMTAYVNYINDTGGIGGRKLSYVSEDDGGETCPEQHAAAATALVNDDKVFMDLAGLHQVSDLLASDHLPFEGGESALSEQNQQGYGQFQILQDADGDFTNWAAFGKVYIASDKNTPCFIYPNEDDFPTLKTLLDSKVAAQGYGFKDQIAYQDDASTAAQQAETYAVQMKADGCKQVWSLANNALGDIFFTAAAAQQNWYPTWTWTSRTAGIDTALFGALMNASEWANSIGLTNRVPSGTSSYQGHCAAIYAHYYPGDGESSSANAQLYCPLVLLASEAMRRAVDQTGVLTGNSLMVGVNAIKGDFFFDATVPINFNISLTSQSTFTGFNEETVGHWSASAGDIAFPEFPAYWKVMGPGKSNGLDIRPQLTKTYTYSKPGEYSYTIPGS